jgi:hypothetical protein
MLDATTLHCINSSVCKLSALTKVCKVYRGVSLGVLPREFWQSNDKDVRGGVEFSFMSTTRHRHHRTPHLFTSYPTPLNPSLHTLVGREVAMQYLEPGVGASLLFEIPQGMIDRGADLSWLSQCARCPWPPTEDCC